MTLNYKILWDYGLKEQIINNLQCLITDENINIVNFHLARVTAQYSAIFRLITEKGEILAENSGKLTYSAQSQTQLPVIGDWVLCTLDSDEKHGVIEYLVPRINRIVRKKAGNRWHAQVIAANLDLIIITSAVDNDYNPSRIERYLTLAQEAQIPALLVFNKMDLQMDLQIDRNSDHILNHTPGPELNHKPDPESDPELELNLTLLDGETISPDRTIDSNGKDNINRIIKEIKERFSHVQYIFTSAITKKGVSELEESLIPGMTVTFLGSSGVGKSSLINQLAQTDLARTKTIRESDSRGRHTTTHKEMFLLKNKSILIDNPGMREVGLWGDEDDINQNFEDINCYTEQCRFNDCTHKCEPGCAVIEALEDNIIDIKRYEAFIKQQEEIKSLNKKRELILASERRSAAAKDYSKHNKSDGMAKSKLKENSKKKYKSISKELKRLKKNKLI